MGSVGMRESLTSMGGRGDRISLDQGKFMGQNSLARFFHVLSYVFEMIFPFKKELSNMPLESLGM